MNDVRKLRGYFVNGTCWAGRILGTLLAVLVLVIFIGETLSGEGPGNPFKYTLPVVLEFVGIFAAWVGVIIAWKWRLIGGLLTVSGILVFHIVGSKLWINWVFGIFMLVGILNLVCWWLKKRSVKPEGK